MDDKRQPDSEDSVGRAVYEDLVRLTFICGRGLPLPDLMERFLVAIRPSIPASGVWLHNESTLVARSCDPGVTDIPVPRQPRVWQPPAIQGDGTILAYVAPGLTFTCLLAGHRVQRAADVVLLFARILALAWQAETVSRPEYLEDSYATAKANFKRRWLRHVLDKYTGNVSECARAAGVSRVYLYEMMHRYDTAPR